MSTSGPPHDAVVLAGGAARRLGGVDKPALEVGGRTLVQHVVDACAGAGSRRIVVVGPPRPLEHDVITLREEPPGGGPVAGLVAGLGAVREAYVLLLAGDLPFLTAGVLESLLRAAVGCDGALLTDDAGRDQLLVGAWRAEALRDRLHDLRRLGRLGDPPGGPLRRVLAGLDAQRVQPAPSARPPWWDCDTAADVDEARRRS